MDSLLSPEDMMLQGLEEGTVEQAAEDLKSVGKGALFSPITGAADVYVSDFGNHTVKLDRFMRDQAVLCIDPGYVGLASLRPLSKEELAKTGDSTKWLLTAEYALVVQNPDAHAKIQNVGA